MANKNATKATKTTTKATKAGAKRKQSTTTKASKAVAEVAPPVAPPVEVVTAPTTNVEVEEKSSVDNISSEYTAFLAKIQQACNLLSSLRAEFRVLERKSLRELRAADKLAAKRRRRSSTRAPSGFVKPTLISDELASFLSKPTGTEMARTEVTREINAYIREHKLQDSENGRKINADKKLSSLLSLTPNDELTYFNLQKYMSRHFAKASDSKVSSS